MKDTENKFSTKVRNVGLRQPSAGVTVYNNVAGHIQRITHAL